MSKDAAEILKEALALPADDRAALADSLLESLDAESDPGVEESWRAEVRRRIEQIDSGAVEMVPWEEARRRLRALLPR